MWGKPMSGGVRWPRVWSSVCGPGRVTLGHEVVFMLACLILMAGHAAADVWYVNTANTSSTQNGKSWSTAYKTIQPAIDAAYLAGGGDVWVAQGTYNEARSSDPHGTGANTGSLIMRRNVNLYGGFKGTETSRNQRDWANQTTTIDGSKARGGQVSYHVIIGASSSILDGFSLRGGSAQGGTASDDPRKVGGGVFNKGVSPTFVNCSFAGLSASTGGGAIFNDGASPNIDNCTFTNNNGGGRGGAIYNFGSSTPNITNSRFNGNSVSTTNGYGGAIFSYRSHGKLEGCTLTNNTARFGGAVFNDDSSPRYTATIFRNNNATWEGGGVNNNGSSSPTFTRCVLEDNSANKGGAVFGVNSSTSFVNCVIRANSASTQGGGIYGAASASFMNCTFSSNTAGSGHAYYNVGTSAPRLTNCIIWGGSSPQLANVNSNAVITYSCVRGGYAGTGNISSDPLFVGVGGASLSLRPGSPCIDKGTSSNAPSNDLLNRTRPQGSGYDMGAYEGPTCVLTTAVTGNGTVEPAAGTYTYFTQGAQATVKATADAGWQFARWEGDASGSQNPVTLTMTGNRTVRAVFVRLYTLTTETVGQGSIQPAPGTRQYSDGTIVRVTATPVAGWRFDHWEGSVSGAANPIDVTMNQNRTVRAVFVREFSLTIQSTGNGIVLPSPGTRTYTEGTSVPLLATPAEGWRFVGWQGDVTGTENPTSVVMNANKTVTAVFEAIPVYTLSIVVEGQGSTTPEPGTRPIIASSTVSITPVPADQWKFDHWEGDASGSETPLVFTMTGNRTIKAVFVAIDPLAIQDYSPKVGLVLGGTVITANVTGWTDTCRLYMAGTPCEMLPPAKSGSKAVTVVRAAVPSLVAGQYTLRVIDEADSDEASAVEPFTYLDDPFSSLLTEDFDQGLAIEDGDPAVSTFALRAVKGAGGPLPSMHFVTPEGIDVTVPSGAFPANTVGAFVIARSSATVTALFPGATMPANRSITTPVIDLHLILKTGEGKLFERFMALAQPIALAFPVLRNPDLDALYPATLATTLDGRFALVIPAPPAVLETGALYGIDLQGRATVEVEELGGHMVLRDGVLGDTSGDGVVNAVDVQLAANAILGLDIGGRNADVNGDGQVNALDIQLVVAIVLGNF